MNLKARAKDLIFGLLGKDPDAVVVSFLTGEPSIAQAMAEEIRTLEPGRRHETVAAERGSTWQLYLRLRRRFRRQRIGLAPVLFTPDKRYRALRRAAFLLAPGKILAYNAKLERHHLRLRSCIASWLFLRGVPLDRIYLRPQWLIPWRKDRTVIPAEWRLREGRPFSALPRAAVLSPYFPYPLTHGGAVRIFHLLREAARDFDIVLFAFTEGEQAIEAGPVLEFCAKVVLVPKPRYREPRWASLRPPEVCEYRSPAMRQLWNGLCREWEIAVRQVEYTALAAYPGEVVVEHDVTFDLFGQVHRREHSVASWWNWWRWRRFETAALKRFQRVVAMSDKDGALLGSAPTVVIPNGVDLGRFQPEPERPGRRLLFVGSFRHFPNVVAYRFFVEQVWPRLRERFADIELTAVAGPDPLLYWREAADSLEPPGGDGVRLLEFVRDVRPLYAEANVVIVPTLVSAGTNLKVLEAMAMERAVVSTSSGCAGLGLRHGVSAWIADEPEEFAKGVVRLLEDDDLRRVMATAARCLAEETFDWRNLGRLQRSLWQELAYIPVAVRKAAERDIPELDRIQKASPEAVLWEPWSYLSYDCRVAESGGAVAGFVVCRTLSAGESEILSLVVDPALRRRGIASRLIREVMDGAPGTWFLEVRESNAAAQALYAKFGFQEVARRSNYYHDTGETAVVMRRNPVVREP